MDTSNEELMKTIRYYQQGLDKYTTFGNGYKLISIFGKLKRLPITIAHLEKTGIGRTVNNLRNLGEDVGEAADSLVALWKDMVIKEEERITENAVNESISVPCPPIENDFNSYGKQENSCTEESGQYHKKESSSSHKSSDTEIKSSEKCETDKSKKYSNNSSSRSLQEKEHKWSSNKERRQESDSSSDAHSSTKHYNSNSGFESEEVYESKHSKSKKKERKRKSKSRRSSDSKSKRESDCEESNFSSKHESKKSYESSSDKDVKHKSKRESKSRHDKESSSKSNKSRSHSSRSDKHEKNDKEESKIEESKGKHSHKNDEPRKHEEKLKKAMDERKSNRKEKSSSSHRPEGSKISSSSSNHRSSFGIKSKDNVKVVMPVNTKEIINGIDSGSGVSFAEALLIFDPLDSKSSTSNKENTSSILSTEKPKSSSSYVKPDNTKIVEEDDVPSLLKEQPPKSLNQNICGLLSEITSNHKPVGFQVDMQPKKMLTQDKALGQVISKKNIRTKVYSGIKSHGRVETLFDLSLRVLQDNIDALAYTGGVPDSLIIPVLEKATADQLFNMERHHPHMIEQTDALWLMHCQKEFRNEKREASESWREMYVRCLDEREAKLSAITANIKQSQDKSIPIRTTKLAYIDSVVKPPRNIARKQAKNGILFDKKPAQTPASRFAASALSGGVKKMVTPNPENRAVKRSSSSSSTGEMAALYPGVQYGLSSQQNFGENKDLIFVKLTDSAIHAIEEYIKNQKFSSDSPTIKFLGNENGELSFPSLHHANGKTSFSFSMSSTADMEGQGGSFECITQLGSPRGPLEGLGSIPYKIRIHANEDVYAVTRNRMTEAEDKYKNKCTREIKPNQTDIGRKEKVKQTRPPVLPIRKEVLSMPPSIQPSYQSSIPSKSTPPLVQSSTNGLSNGLGSNHVSSSRPQLSSKKPSVPDIARRPLKERLIHLLALKPFRKFELHHRLTKEGLREKNGWTSVLKQVSSYRDNYFHLNGPMWNEVHEDWPFYSELERQILKRRKPQNLTLPGSSDGGSSGSGQSPTSTHPGSPPPITSTKRPGFHDGPDGFPYKRRRIAHGIKLPEQTYRQPIESNSQLRPITDSRDTSNMIPRSRESPNGYLTSINGYVNGMLNDKRNLSDDEDNTNRKRSCDIHSRGFGVSREKTFLNNRSSSPANKIIVEEARKDILSERQNGLTNVMDNGRIKQEERERAREKERERNSVVKRSSSSSSTGEMAALYPGVPYGLSSQQNFGENKDLIFVKLTDSAIHAIEEYIKNQKFSSDSPTIKFLGNENGELSFPSLHHANGNTSFSFSMSSTANTEGPGGSFECIKQAGSPRGPLEGLGSIPYKIRIHANEDVYAVTRNRMTEAEDKYKNKCTREIKPNQTHIGRKEKVKQTRPPVLPIRKEVPSMPPSIQPSYQSSIPSKSTPPLVQSSTNGLGSNHVSSSRPQLSSKKPSVPDIAQRPLKERLIHLLALKPFRKFELHDRLTKEGLREKNGWTSVLKQVSSCRDNCFHLNRPMWDEVHEDWPFYSETERQILKRRKPQNLTLPGSSDGGSSGSGQSPTSTHPGPDGFPYKRRRIAHGIKLPEQTHHQPIESNSQRRPITDSRDTRNMISRSWESPNGYLASINGYVNGVPNDKRNLSDDEDNTNRKRSCDSHSISFGVSREKTFLNNRSSSPANKIIVEEVRKEILSERQNGLTNVMDNGRIKQEERERERGKERERNKYNKVTSSTQNIIARVSPDSQTVSIPPSNVKIEEAQNEFPDYKLQYVTIQDLEQRRRYKSDFNADYAEYRDLHGVVEKVSRRLAQLEERLKQEDENSPRFKDIKKQAMREYQENKKDLDHQRAKQRFTYLEDKLSHIKRLVLEYDHGMTNSQ